MNKIGDKLTFQPKRQHDYYYQVQCQLYCCDLEWCDFVVRTEKELHVERIYRDRKWWASQLEKLREFYFNSLLPELACPRKGKGGDQINIPSHFYFICTLCNHTFQQHPDSWL